MERYDLNLIKPEYRAEFRELVEGREPQGGFRKEFLDYLDTDTQAQRVCDTVMEQQADELRGLVGRLEEQVGRLRTQSIDVTGILKKNPRKTS